MISRKRNSIATRILVYDTIIFVFIILCSNSVETQSPSRFRFQDEFEFGIFSDFDSNIAKHSSDMEQLGNERRFAGKRRDQSAKDMHVRSCIQENRLRLCQHGPEGSSSKSENKYWSKLFLLSFLFFEQKSSFHLFYAIFCCNGTKSNDCIRLT